VVQLDWECLTNCEAEIFSLNNQGFGFTFKTMMKLPPKRTAEAHLIAWEKGLAKKTYKTARERERESERERERRERVKQEWYRHAGMRESDSARLQTSPDCQGRSFGLQNSAWLVKFCLAGLGKTITLGFYRTWHIYT
jgi:hypothetical protein